MLSVTLLVINFWILFTMEDLIGELQDWSPSGQKDHLVDEAIQEVEYCRKSNHYWVQTNLDNCLQLLSNLIINRSEFKKL